MDKPKKKICLITPNHIATNPRLVKEGIALTKAGYAVHIIFTVSDRGGWDPDRNILTRNPDWKYDVLDWSGKDFLSAWSRFRSGLLKKAAQKIFLKTKAGYFAKFVVNRNYQWQLKKAVAAKADLYIGHNLGALPVAKAAARKAKARYGFDAEDFHRHESFDDINAPDVILKSVVEESNLPGLHHFTAASPLIGKAYQTLFPSLRPVTILNVFPKTSVGNKFEKNETTNLKLFWFSQTVGENRGLETILHAISLSRQQNFELHLLGNCHLPYRIKLEQLAESLGLRKKLFFYDPVPESEIFELAAKCDIGMASEVGAPLNRDICLTNKIFTYVQSGLAVMASDTTAQIQFLHGFPSIGEIYKKENPDSLAERLSYYAENRTVLESCKKENLALGQRLLNWEAEQEKLVSAIDTVWN